MAIVGALTRGFAKSQKKVSAVSASITGTGGVAMGLPSSIDAGSPQATVQNAPTTITTDVATVTSISGATVNVAVIALAAAANSIAGGALTVGVLATGY